MSKKNKTPSDKKPIIFKKYRGGIELTKEEIKYIKRERKKLRKEMKSRGLRSKRDFETTASSLGLYFDDKRRGILFWIFGNGKALRYLLGALILFLLGSFLLSIFPQLPGHFTINMSPEMMRNGFVLSETKDFANPSIQLFSDPVEDAPCISFSMIPEDVDQYEGNHSDGTYFAYTFFLRNEGQDTVDYAWQLEINDESQNVSSATWVMVFEDGEMSFYAKANKNGETECIPAKNVNDRGYPNPELLQFAKNKDQFEVVGRRNNKTYYRIHPISFVSEDIVAENLRYDIAPQDVHKYTVVIWLEGDDPECVDELIGGHLGLEMNFLLIEEVDDSSDPKDVWEQIRELFEELTDNLRFWE